MEPSPQTHVWRNVGQRISERCAHTVSAEGAKELPAEAELDDSRAATRVALKLHSKRLASCILIAY